MNDIFDNVAPIDYRYVAPHISEFLSERSFTAEKLRVEVALAKALAARGICSDEVARKIDAATLHVSTFDVYQEEVKTKHDIRALVNCLQRHVFQYARPFVHLTATSFDISDTANIRRYKKAVTIRLLPWLRELLSALITLTLKEAGTLQIGRTHGQHAVPITFGFAIAQYVSRLGNSIETIEYLTNGLCGKFSGAVGAYNASALFVDDPEQFETDILEFLDLKPAEISTQIAPPEPLMRVLIEITIAAGIIANLSRDMRHLQRTEIAEVGEAFGETQVGSSTMVHKMNPINWENLESMWKILVGRVVTLFLVQHSEHQRDLTGSASGRTYGEIIGYAIGMAERAQKTTEKLSVNREQCLRNLEREGDLILAEPLYLILASLGHTNAHERVRQLSMRARAGEGKLLKIAELDGDLAPFLSKMTPRQREILSNPRLYGGIAEKKARAVAERWKQKLGL